MAAGSSAAEPVVGQIDHSRCKTITIPKSHEERDQMQVNTYLNFDGNCEAAFKFYTEALNGTIEAMVPHEGTPAGAHVPAEWSKKIPLTPRLSVGITLLMG